MFTKFPAGLFLEKVELERLQKSLDEKGFRQFLLNNTLKFGLIDKQYFNTSNIVQNQFTNGGIYESAGLTISHNEINGLDINGNFIYKKATTNIAVPADSNWYWVKIKHEYTSKELGIFSIDDSGNLIGDSTSELLSIFRGQPYFPTRIKFLNSTYNTVEYDVLEVIDDSNAILQGYFTPETGLSISIIGTFAPDVTPADVDKNIFQYDDCLLTLVQESSLNVAPTKIDGEEFYLARVKNNGVDLFIQDKRTEKWETKSNFYLNNLDKAVNPLLGVEQIRFDHPYSTKDHNIVDIAWVMRSSNWTVNPKLNLVTLSSGQGGRYRDVSYFNDGEFDGWLLYWTDGSFSNIISSVTNGGQINLTLDILDVDKVSSDGGITFNAGELLVTPNAEEIEITFAPYTGAGDEPEVTTIIKTLPINKSKELFKILAFNTTCQYAVSYRLKRNGEYSASMTMLPDTQFGNYTEKAFDSNGYILPLVQSQSYSVNLAAGNIVLYTTNRIILTMKNDAYFNQISAIDLGDTLGAVAEWPIIIGTNDTTLTVGVDAQYQYIKGGFLTLNDNKRIILADGLRAGNKFFLHYKQTFDLNTYTIRIVNSTFGVLKEFTDSEIGFLLNSTEGIFIQCTWSGTEWILNSLNEVKKIDPVLENVWTMGPTGGTPSVTYYMTNFLGSTSTVATDLPSANYDRILYIYGSSSVTTPSDARIEVENGVASSNFLSLARMGNFDSMMAFIPAGCRFRVPFTIGGGSYTLNCRIQKFNF